MTTIEYKQFIDYLLKGPKAVYSDLLVDKYLYFQKDFENADEQTRFYYEDGAVVEYSEYQSNDGVTVFCAICQVEDNINYHDLIQCINNKIRKRMLYDARRHARLMRSAVPIVCEDLNLKRKMVSYHETDETFFAINRLLLPFDIPFKQADDADISCFESDLRDFPVVFRFCVEISA